MNRYERRETLSRIKEIEREKERIRKGTKKYLMRLDAEKEADRLIAKYKGGIKR